MVHRRHFRVEGLKLAAVAELRATFAVDDEVNACSFRRPGPVKHLTDAFTAKFGRPLARSEDDVAPFGGMERDRTAG